KCHTNSGPPTWTPPPVTASRWWRTKSKAPVNELKIARGIVISALHPPPGHQEALAQQQQHVQHDRHPDRQDAHHDDVGLEVELRVERLAEPAGAGQEGEGWDRDPGHRREP